VISVNAPCIFNFDFIIYCTQNSQNPHHFAKNCGENHAKFGKIRYVFLIFILSILTKKIAKTSII
jgi:hypothetical protein